MGSIHVFSNNGYKIISIKKAETQNSYFSEHKNSDNTFCMDKISFLMKYSDMFIGVCGIIIMIITTTTTTIII